MKHHNYKKLEDYKKAKELEKYKELELRYLKARNEALYKLSNERETAKKKFGLVEPSGRPLSWMYSK